MLSTSFSMNHSCSFVIFYEPLDVNIGGICLPRALGGVLPSLEGAGAHGAASDNEVMSSGASVTSAETDNRSQISCGAIVKQILYQNTFGS